MRPRASSSAFSACVMISPVDPESLVCVSAVYMYCSWVACLRVRPAPLSLHSEAHTDRVAHAPMPQKKSCEVRHFQSHTSTFSFATKRKTSVPACAHISELAMRATTRHLRSSPIERPRFDCGLALARPLDVSRREHHRGMRNFHRRCGRVELWRGGGGEVVIEQSRPRDSGGVVGRPSPERAAVRWRRATRSLRARQTLVLASGHRCRRFAATGRRSGGACMRLQVVE